MLKTISYSISIPFRHRLINSGFGALCFDKLCDLQVAAHLFQAGANIVKLGIQKSRGSSPDRYLGMY
jgi:hypothetical protein